MEYYGVRLQYEALDTEGRCGTRACPYPGNGIVVYDEFSGNVEKRMVCWLHFLVGSSPWSLEYQGADSLLCIPSTPKVQRRFVSSLSRAPGEWDHFRVKLLRRTGFSYKTSLAIISREAQAEGRFTHYPDPIYNMFTELRRSMVYSLCGEKVIDSLTVGFDLKPTCPDCVRMHQIQVANLPPAPKRQALLTLPKPKEEHLSFEEMVVEGLVGYDDKAYSCRRNWGERNGRAWSDPSSGVQRDWRLRQFRGGTNRKRG